MGKTTRVTLTITAASIGLASLAAYASRDTAKAVPFYEYQGCLYDIIHVGPLQKPDAQVTDMRLGEAEHDLAIRRDTDPKAIPSLIMNHKGEAFHSEGSLYDDQDGVSTLIYSSGDANDRRVVSGIQTKTTETKTRSPSFILRSRNRTVNCVQRVRVYAEDASAISHRAILNVEQCTAPTIPSCDHDRAFHLPLTCRMRSNFPKGRALYVATNDGRTTATLVDWSTMVDWRFDDSSYQPYSRPRTCVDPFTT